MAEAKRSRHETAHLLNDDVVGEIISFLSFKELLRYQRVQKQWQNIIREFIPRMPYLDLANFCDTDATTVEAKLSELLGASFSAFSARRVNLSAVNVSDSFLKLLLSQNKNLRELNLTSCRSITNVDFIFPQLEYLNISNTNITSSLDVTLPDLKTIIGNETIFPIIKRSPNIETIAYRCNARSKTQALCNTINSTQLPKLKIIDFGVLFNFNLPIRTCRLPSLTKIILISLQEQPIMNAIPYRGIVYKSSKLPTHTPRELSELIGKHFTFNDIINTAVLTKEKIIDYDINVNLYAKHVLMTHTETLEAILDAGVSMNAFTDPSSYYAKNLKEQVLLHPHVIPVVMKYPRVRALDLADGLYQVIGSRAPSKENIIKCLTSYYQYDDKLLANSLRAVVHLDDCDQVNMFKLLENTFTNIKQAMELVVSLETLQEASEHLAKYLLEHGYADGFVNWLPEFNWLPETYCKYVEYKPTIEYLFPSKYREGKAIDADMERLSPIEQKKAKKHPPKDTSDGTRPSTFQDAMIDIKWIRPYTKLTRLHYAAENEHVTPHMLAVLVESGVPINATNKAKETALRVLFEHQKSSCIRYMLLHGGTLGIPSENKNETVICRISDQSKLKNPIVIQMKIEYEDTHRIISFIYDDHDDSDKYFIALYNAAANVVQVEKNDHPNTENRFRTKFIGFNTIV